METTRLEEYRTLRAAILASFTRQDSRLALAWTGVPALLGVAAVAKIPELGFLGFGVVVAACRDHQAIVRGVQRISAYIEIVIEPALPELRW